MGKPLETLYFEWLCSKTNIYSDFTFLLDKLYSYEFVWLIQGDDNRVEDCYDLRLEFFRENQLNLNEGFLNEWIHSVLEVLVAFSNRASFETDMPPSNWFWILLDNLSLTEFPDDNFSVEAESCVEDILYKFVWRLYDRKGIGGLFPLSRTRNDQRKVEIWYQFSEYLVENGYL